MTQHLKAYLRYPGAKWASGRWITSHFPSHECYVELFAGSAACYFLKVPAKHSVLNDLSSDVLVMPLKTHAAFLCFVGRRMVRVFTVDQAGHVVALHICLFFPGGLNCRIAF